MKITITTDEVFNFITGKRQAAEENQLRYDTAIWNDAGFLFKEATEAETGGLYFWPRTNSIGAIIDFLKGDLTTTSCPRKTQTIRDILQVLITHQQARRAAQRATERAPQLSLFS